MSQSSYWNEDWTGRFAVAVTSRVAAFNMALGCRQHVINWQVQQRFFAGGYSGWCLTFITLQLWWNCNSKGSQLRGFNYAASSAEDTMKERSFGRPIRLYLKMKANRRVWEGRTTKQAYGVPKFDADNCGHRTAQPTSWDEHENFVLFSSDATDWNMIQVIRCHYSSVMNTADRLDTADG